MSEPKRFSKSVITFSGAVIFFADSTTSSAVSFGFVQGSQISSISTSALPPNSSAVFFAIFSTFSASFFRLSALKVRIVPSISASPAIMFYVVPE